jgi:hypothetical protein
MRNKRVKDYSEDDSTHTLSIITGITEHGCIVSDREYTYVDEDTLEVRHAAEITLETLSDNDEQVTRSLEELREAVEQDVEFDV